METQSEPEQGKEQWFVVAPAHDDGIAFSEWAGRTSPVRSLPVQHSASCPVCGTANTSCHDYLGK